MLQENYSNSSRRIKKDIEQIQLTNLNDQTALCQLNLQNEIIITITPLDGPFKSSTYQFMLKFGYDYPYKPPKVEVISWLTHPNINLKQKTLYLQLLDQSQWKPVYTILDILVEMKKTLTFIDYSYIPNTLSSIMSVQRSGKVEHSTDEEEVEDNTILTNKNFLHNFELQMEEKIITEGESGYDTENEVDTTSDQLPQVLNLNKQQHRRYLEDTTTLKQ